MGFDGNVGKITPNFVPIQSPTTTGPSAPPTAEQLLQAETQEYLETHVASTLERPKIVTAADAKIIADIPGTATSHPVRKPGEITKLMSLTKDHTEAGAKAILAQGTQALARALKKHTTPNQRKEKRGEGKKEPRPQQELTEEEEDQKNKQKMEEAAISWDEINRINADTKAIYDAADGMFGLIKANNEKSQYIMWPKV